MPRPAFPVRSMFAGFEQTGFASGQPGILNAAALSHRLIEGPPGGSVLTPATTSGQPPMVLVFEGSNPEKLGVKNWPDCPMAFQAICQSPNADCNKAELWLRSLRPRPNGNW